MAGRLKLTEEQRRAVNDDPRPYAEIAMAFGISIPTVARIKTVYPVPDAGAVKRAPGEGRFYRRAW